MLWLPAGVEGVWQLWGTAAEHHREGIIGQFFYIHPDNRSNA